MGLDRERLIGKIVTAFGADNIEDEGVKADVTATATAIALAVDEYVRGIEVEVPSGISLTATDGFITVDGATTESVDAEIS